MVAVCCFLYKYNMAIMNHGSWLTGLRLVIVCLMTVYLKRIYCQVFSFGRCPDVQLMKAFDIEQYYGKWYENRKFYALFEAGLTCIQAEYTPKTDGKIRVFNSGIRSDGTLNSIEGVAYAPNPEHQSKLRVGFTSYAPEGDYWILDTDYISYALVYSCNEIFGPLGSYQLAWILTREMIPEKAIIEKAINTFKSQGVDVSKFEATDQTSCKSNVHITVDINATIEKAVEVIKKDDVCTDDFCDADE